MDKLILLKVVQDLRDLADSVHAVAEALPDNTPASAQKPIAPEQVRAVLAEKSRDGHTAAVRALLAKYGAAKLSEITPDKYAKLLADAEALGCE